MSKLTPITDEQLRALRLVLKETKADGWARITGVKWMAIIALPKELVQFEHDLIGRGGLARLTPAGQRIAEIIK